MMKTRKGHSKRKIHGLRTLLRAHDRLACLLLGMVVSLVAGLLLSFTQNVSLCALVGVLAGCFAGLGKTVRDGFRHGANVWDFIFCYLGSIITGPIVMLAVALTK